ncbi:N-methyl-D-aspartate receptor NMDAR2C subunit [Massilia niabensis]|uniref:N-methyl-D-aspartate receptor NMDAR2C subunit n=1 Tax=Massilia niabensis TaxID=544910 RepID=A0ABW0L6G9_9BURK
MSFHARWEGLWQALGKPLPAGLLGALLAAYGEPQRHYHTLQHLAECFAHLDEAQAPAGQAREVELALWFHDAVYDVHVRDNERRSADWALRDLGAAGLPPGLCERVAFLVMSTAHDAPAASPDAQLLTDIDLAILGAPRARFAEYERQIRAEYAHVLAALFAGKRREVLQGFLERDRIYQTAHFATRYEQAARANLAQAIALPG